MSISSSGAWPDRQDAPGLQRQPLVLFILAALSQMPAVVHAAPAPTPEPAPEPGPQPMEFSAAFLGDSASNYDMSRFERGNTVPPGEYRVDLYLNRFRISRESVAFRAQEGGEVRPCFNPTLLSVMGVDIARLEAAGADLGGDCIDLPAAIADAQVQYDSAQLRLDVSIPQVALNRLARGYVDPKLWEQGINALTLGYQLNVSGLDYEDGTHSQAAYLGLNAGLNVGGWRIRNQSNYRWDREGGSGFQNVNTYAQHDVTALQSQLTVGETFTSGELFDSVGFRGVMLATDTRMRPESMNGYAPVVRGVAETNALVQIRQAGYVIYEATVAPGAFEIDDLNATGYGGDLNVTVTEADGRQRTFSVPYAAVPQLLRPGSSKFAATAGRMRDDRLASDAPWFAEGTYQRGISNLLTGYGGAQIAEGNLYGNLLVGAAFNTPVGAVSLDVSGSRTRFSGADDRRGHSARLTYSKSVPATHTDFALAAYRYSSRGYLSLSDAVRLDDAVRSGPMAGGVAEGVGGERARFQLSLSQQLGDNGGSLFVSGSRNEYWDEGRPVDSSFQVGWNKQLRDVLVGVTASRAKTIGEGYDNRYYLSLSVPLGRSSYASRPPQLDLGVSRAPDGNNVQAGVAGTAGARQQFNYGIHGNFDDTNTDSIGINAGWRAAYAALGTSYTRGADSRQWSANASGGIVVHGGGVTLTPQLGDTIGVVEAKGARGARVNGDIGKVDGRGYAIANNLMPYRMNEVTLDPKGISPDVELDTSRLQTVPRAGAVVPLSFATRKGRAVLLHVQLQDGQTLPFGSQIVDVSGQEVGVSGQAGQVFLRYSGRDDEVLTARWGQGNECTLDRIPQDFNRDRLAPVVSLTSTCRAGASNFVGH